MKLEEKSTKELLALHNSIADAPAGPKTFATRAKLVARIVSIAEDKAIDLSTYAISGEPSTAAPTPNPGAALELPEESGPAKKRGSGIGELARALLMDSTAYPHAVIAAMVNADISGATATAKSVRWYAAKMRKEGIDVPARSRAKVFPANMDEKQSEAWLKTVVVVEGPKK